MCFCFKDLKINRQIIVFNTFNFITRIYDLAKNHSTILLNGDGFASCRWGLRVSLANLNDEAYILIGQTLRKIFNNLVNEFELSSQEQ